MKKKALVYVVLAAILTALFVPQVSAAPDTGTALTTQEAEFLDKLDYDHYEPEILSVEYTGFTQLVAGCDANIPVAVETKNASRQQVFTGLFVDGVKLAEAKVTDGKAVIKAPAVNGSEAYVAAWFENGEPDEATKKPVTIRSLPANIWAPEAVSFDGVTTVSFDSGITLIANAAVKIAGVPVTDFWPVPRYNNNTLQINKESLSGQTIEIKGIKYPDLFPSYSFTFKLNAKVIDDAELNYCYVAEFYSFGGSRRILEAKVYSAVDNRGKVYIVSPASEKNIYDNVRSSGHTVGNTDDTVKNTVNLGLYKYTMLKDEIIFSRIASPNTDLSKNTRLDFISEDEGSMMADYDGASGFTGLLDPVGGNVPYIAYTNADSVFFAVDSTDTAFPKVTVYTGQPPSYKGTADNTQTFTTRSFMIFNDTVMGAGTFISPYTGMVKAAVFDGFTIPRPNPVWVWGTDEYGVYTNGSGFMYAYKDASDSSLEMYEFDKDAGVIRTTNFHDKICKITFKMDGSVDKITVYNDPPDVYDDLSEIYKVFVSVYDMTVRVIDNSDKIVYWDDIDTSVQKYYLIDKTGESAKYSTVDIKSFDLQNDELEYTFYARITSTEGNTALHDLWIVIEKP